MAVLFCVGILFSSCEKKIIPLNIIDEGDPRELDNEGHRGSVEMES
jgi:hypothetical protein